MPSKAAKDVADIQNPRRILAVALTSAQDHLANVIGKLTGTYPSGAFAGSTHDLVLDTAYYRAQVPVWLDLVGADEEEGEKGEEQKPKQEKSPYDSDDDDDNDAVQAWADAFLADEAREVRDALGGIVAVVDAADARQQRALVNHVGRLARGCAPVEEATEEEEIQGLSAWDGVGLVVGVAAAPLSDDAVLAWDDVCVEAGLEFVLVAPGQADANEWGEKTGVARVLEALQANDWHGGGGGLGGDDDSDPFGAFQDGDGDDGVGRGKGLAKYADKSGEEENDDDDRDSLVSLDFGYDKSDFEGLRQAIWQQQTREVEGDEDNDDKDDKDDKNDDDDIAVEKLIQKLQAARMQGELLPPAQRRAMAARVVGEVMKEI